MTTLPHTPISLPQHIDSTMLSSFRSCPKKFFWTHIRGLHPRSRSADLHAGGCFASGLEQFYKTLGKGTTVEDAKLSAFKTFTKEWGDYIAPEKNPKSQDNMWIALDDYLRTYPPAIDRFQFLTNPDGSPTAEFTFAIPLDFEGFPLHPSGEPFFYTGRTDGLGMYDKIHLCFKDEKTTKSIGARWAEQWALRGQFIGYCWAGKMSGLDISHVLVRGIGILKTEIKQIEILKHYPQHLIDRWFLQLRNDLERLVDCWNAGYFDMNFGETCTAYGVCQYVPLCESSNPESWTDTYEIRHWNPLNRVPVEEGQNA